MAPLKTGGSLDGTEVKKNPDGTGSRTRSLLVKKGQQCRPPLPLLSPLFLFSTLLLLSSHFIYCSLSPHTPPSSPMSVFSSHLLSSTTLCYPVLCAASLLPLFLFCLCLPSFFPLLSFLLLLPLGWCLLLSFSLSFTSPCTPYFPLRLLFYSVLSVLPMSPFLVPLYSSRVLPSSADQCH